MKKIVLVLIFAVSAFAVNAQVRFGLKAGVNIATLGGDDFDEVDGKKSNTGFYFGGLVNIPFSDNFAFQPEVIYSAKQGLEYEESGSELNLNLGYINVPLMLQYTNSGFFAEAGPQIGFLLTSKAKLDGTEFDIDDVFKGIDFGINLGLGYTLSSGVGFNARYNFGLSNIADDEDSDVKNRVFSVGLHYIFGGNKKGDK